MSGMSKSRTVAQEAGVLRERIFMAGKQKKRCARMQ